MASKRLRVEEKKEEEEATRKYKCIPAFIGDALPQCVEIDRKGENGETFEIYPSFESCSTACKNKYLHEDLRKSIISMQDIQELKTEENPTRRYIMRGLQETAKSKLDKEILTLKSIEKLISRGWFDKDISRKICSDINDFVFQESAFNFLFNVLNEELSNYTDVSSIVRNLLNIFHCTLTKSKYRMSQAGKEEFIKNLATNVPSVEGKQKYQNIIQDLFEHDFFDDLNDEHQNGIMFYIFENIQELPIPLIAKIIKRYDFSMENIKDFLYDNMLKDWFKKYYKEVLRPAGLYLN